MSSEDMDIQKEIRRRKLRQKVPQACGHCRKGHMTCSAGRPCQPCISRGLAESCVDAPRKKKKYMTDIPDYSISPVSDVNNGNGSSMTNSNSIFMSSTADLEYNILGSITRDNFTETPEEHLVAGPRFDNSCNQYFIGPSYTFSEVVEKIRDFKALDPETFMRLNDSSAVSFSVAAQSMGSGNGLKFQEPSEIYSKIKQPFPYPKFYHVLNLYLRRRFDKKHLVSMSKSMAEYRPSFIAGMIHLKEDDMIFTEQCFQRTLLEYDNYISTSGTPTLVWRRTSQIEYVGDEFCVLTGWSKEQLLNKPTFVVEIMDDKSCVEYFQLFSKIAFGDFRGATMLECTLLTPTGDTIRTSSIWTLKRDVFGIPMMIIANFLPTLQ
ncbi:unnamed protein product [Kuraishia capsulata CBS 1993]|uniref:Transcription activator of gluconeogenesis ERT1 n=1 Tax=Kuraishia capsulata CBS 1993 TaxID=1382522 RepID=W6MFF7_9ASCO|nr:uncharacterized protein KUCA_T00000271001 [Kuraishia capsulata CBS 1993]CDK24311.1 unnamed protein product [Kuraishia capsulata CBS 1993]